MNLTYQLNHTKENYSPTGVWISPVVYLLGFVDLNCHADDIYENFLHE